MVEAARRAPVEVVRPVVALAELWVVGFPGRRLRHYRGRRDLRKSSWQGGL
jgi:hypothetical protein